jgi:hypothetical protein
MYVLYVVNMKARIGTLSGDGLPPRSRSGKISVLGQRKIMDFFCVAVFHFCFAVVITYEAYFTTRGLLGSTQVETAASLPLPPFIATTSFSLVCKHQ